MNRTDEWDTSSNSTNSSDSDWVERNYEDENREGHVRGTFFNGYLIDCEDSVVIGAWNYTYLIAGPYETL